MTVASFEGRAAAAGRGRRKPSADVPRWVESRRELDAADGARAVLDFQAARVEREITRTWGPVLEALGTYGVMPSRPSPGFVANFGHAWGSWCQVAQGAILSVDVKLGDDQRDAAIGQAIADVAKKRRAAMDRAAGRGGAL